MKWKPKVGERYWFIDFRFASSFCWRSNGFDRRNCREGNCFRTKKEATQALQRVKKALKGEG